MDLSCTLQCNAICFLFIVQLLVFFMLNNLKTFFAIQFSETDVQVNLKLHYYT